MSEQYRVMELEELLKYTLEFHQISYGQVMVKLSLVKEVRNTLPP